MLISGRCLGVVARALVGACAGFAACSQSELPGGGSAAGSSSPQTKFVFWGQETKRTIAPGNSLPAITNAYALGYDAVEIDLQLTKDARIVLMHDDEINDTTTGKGFVAEMTLAEIQQYELRPAQQPPIPIPTLEDALRVNGRSGELIADLKVGDSALDPLRRAVEAAQFEPHRMIVSVYELEEALRVKAELPGARVVIKRYDEPAVIADADVASVAGLGLDGMMLTMPSDVSLVEPLLDKLHRHGLIMITFVHYPDGTEEQLRTLEALGVDYVLTVHSEWI